jgi:hypothetical protein
MAVDMMDVVPATEFGDDLRAAVCSVECPHCGEPPGAVCRNPSSTVPPSMHKARWIEARRVKAVLDLPCLPGCPRHGPLDIRGSA